MSDPTRPIRTRMADDGTPTAETLLSPEENKIRGECVVPPDTVVPVVFLPGIMGSNLCDEKGKSIWGSSSMVGIFFQWAFRSSSTRQDKLTARKIKVDPGKIFPEPSATVPNKKVAKERGLGEVSVASYGKFLTWLDNALNKEFMDEDCDDPSPWKQWEGRIDIGREWGAEKSPFLPITADESNHAFNNFYCPIHAAGYNWVKSNGDSGKAFVQRVDEIIAYWNDPKNHGGRKWHCEQVILVTHSMGGLVARAAVHPDYGNAADKVLGIIHGVMPATGAPAAYHHCRTGYDFPIGIVLGRNAAQVTAVIANSPGALELLPTQDYPKGWLQARVGKSEPLMRLPTANPYIEIYVQKEPWWRLIDPALIDPAKIHKKKNDDPWTQYKAKTLKITANFHETLSQDYHDPSFANYGADTDKYVAYNTLVWASSKPVPMSEAELLVAVPVKGSDPVTVTVLGAEGKTAKLEIAEPEKGDKDQAGDGTVPEPSGRAPKDFGGGNVKQSFRLTGFGHQPSYDDKLVQQSVLHCVGKLLQRAKVL